MTMLEEEARSGDRLLGPVKGLSLWRHALRVDRDFDGDAAS
jgi:hypothetical protein